MASVFEEIPSPVRVPLTPQQKYERSHHFGIMINWLALGYILVHKLILPYFINYFAVSRSFHYIDWWWVYHVGLGLLLLREHWDDDRLLYTLYFGLGGCAAQVIASFREYNWYIVSLWVTAAASFGVILHVFSTMSFKPAFRVRLTTLALAVPLGVFFQYALFGFTFTVEKKAIEKKAAAEPLHYFPHLVSADQCGTRGVTLKIKDGKVILPKLASLEKIEVTACGFKQTIAVRSRGDSIEIRNADDHYLNIKVYEMPAISRTTRGKSFANFPLRASSAEKMPVTEDPEIILFSSDSDPNKGFTLLLRDPEALDRWVAQVSTVASGTSPAMLLIDRTRFELR